MSRRRKISDAGFYRIRATEFVRLSRLQHNEWIRCELQILADDCINLAEAMDRYPVLDLFDQNEPSSIH